MHSQIPIGFGPTGGPVVPSGLILKTVSATATAVSCASVGQVCAHPLNVEMAIRPANNDFSPSLVLHIVFPCHVGLLLGYTISRWQSRYDSYYKRICSRKRKENR